MGEGSDFYCVRVVVQAEDCLLSLFDDAEAVTEEADQAQDVRTAKEEDCSCAG